MAPKSNAALSRAPDTDLQRRAPPHRRARPPPSPSALHFIVVPTTTPTATPGVPIVRTIALHRRRHLALLPPHPRRRNTPPTACAPPPNPSVLRSNAAAIATPTATPRCLPIRDLPTLASLPPPLTFLGPAPAPYSPTHSTHGHEHGKSSAHSPSQSDSLASYSQSLHVSSASSASTTSSTSDASGSVAGSTKKRCRYRHEYNPTLPAHTVFAAHVQLLSRFFDGPAAPFEVHRMALEGKAAGKDVGI
ncbi:hypothetical protein C8R44DRAFT_891337 [Mycena epipterygia]|nr:hypothetical protein C8R44DRAFT_891337 [Mycena epipterygia]